MSRDNYRLGFEVQRCDALSNAFGVEGDLISQAALALVKIFYGMPAGRFADAETETTSATHELGSVGNLFLAFFSSATGRGRRLLEPIAVKRFNATVRTELYVLDKAEFHA
jgi:hypothetical protein